MKNELNMFSKSISEELKEETSRSLKSSPKSYKFTLEKLNSMNKNSENQQKPRLQTKIQNSSPSRMKEV